MTAFRAVLALVTATLLLAGTALAQTVVGDDAPLRFGRFEHDGKAHYGFLAIGGVHQLSGSFFDPETVRTGKVFPLEEIRLLAPVEPTKVIGIAFNYQGAPAPKLDGMAFFAKLPSAIVGPDAEIVPPPGSSELHYEGELVIVMGLKTRNVSEEDALKRVYGITIGNDVTEHGYGRSPFVVLKAKGADTLSPLGPWIVPGLDYDNLKLETRVNGKVVQKASTRQMIRSCARIIAELSTYMTLEPGDVIYTGTPGKTAPMKPGDVVEVWLEGVGTLKNTVAGQQ
jgi:2-keto-4-pentenoate hydratase/2-oxohepta-3-ene-1,7-dioic acid hydratase in catechol pathway